MVYIATWFYREAADEASYYPQAGRGSSSLVHSVYMQIQVPFFISFKHFNPRARMLFFTNMPADQLPPYLRDTLRHVDAQVITLAYRCRPPRQWFKAWANQFYLYDILRYMEPHLQAHDLLAILDADCLCLQPLDPLFSQAQRDGSALYALPQARSYSSNGTSIEQMETLYQAHYGQPHTLHYFGGELILLRADALQAVNREFTTLARYNFNLPPTAPRLHEEAHFMSVIAAHLRLDHPTANPYIKRLWTHPRFNTVSPGDETLAIWHLPYEKKRGLHRLYRHLLRHDLQITDDTDFRQRASRYCGIPRITPAKRLTDLWLRAGWISRRIIQ